MQQKLQVFTRSSRIENHNVTYCCYVIVLCLAGATVWLLSILQADKVLIFELAANSQSPNVFTMNPNATKMTFGVQIH